jgi:hypothetical protein
MKKGVHIMLSESNLEKLKILKNRKRKSMSSIIDEVLKKTLKSLE